MKESIDEKLVPIDTEADYSGWMPELAAGISVVVLLAGAESALTQKASAPADEIAADGSTHNVGRVEDEEHAPDGEQHEVGGDMAGAHRAQKDTQGAEEHCHDQLRFHDFFLFISQRLQQI